MPRLSTIRVGPLADLADGLKFQPRPAVLRCVRSAEELVSEVAADARIPLAWLIERLTGYRPDADDDAHDVTLLGSAVLSELSAFVEQVTDQARLGPSDLPADSLSLQELCARWRCDRKTVERRRRAGLIARRVRGVRGGTRLMFSIASVERYERIDPESREGGRALSRMTPDECARAVRRATELRAREALSLPQAAARIAGEVRRSRDAVTRALRAHDEGAAAPIFPESRSGGARERALAWRARRWGIPAGAVARRLLRPAQTVRRAANERRADLLRALDLDGPSSPMFARDDAPEALLSSPAVRTGLGAPGESDALVFAAVASSMARPDADTERARAVAMCFLRWLARRRIAALPASDPSAAALDEAETTLRWLALVQIELARSQQGLALRAVEEAAGAPLLELPGDVIRELHAVAMGAVAQAADRFDPFSSQARRLAGPANVALLRVLGPRRGEVPRPSPAAARRSTARTVPLADWTRTVAPWQWALDPHPAVRAGLGRLDPEDRSLLEARFGWAGEPPRTLAEIGRSLGERASRLSSRERRAMRVARGLPPSPRTRDASGGDSVG